MALRKPESELPVMPSKPHLQCDADAACRYAAFMPIVIKGEKKRFCVDHYCEAPERFHPENKT